MYVSFSRSSINLEVQERASALDFKDTAALQLGRSDVVFLSIFSDEHQKLLPVDHQ